MKFKQFKALLESTVRHESLFHMSSNYMNILSSGTLRGSSLAGSDLDANVRVSGENIYDRYGRFISFGRSIAASHYIHGQVNAREETVVLEFDKRKLKSNYRVEPIEYWLNPSRRRNIPEAEDRLLLKHGEKGIDVKKYLIGVHILDDVIMKREAIKSSIKAYQKRIDESPNDSSVEYVKDWINKLTQRLDELEDSLDSDKYEKLMELTDDYKDVPFYVYDNRKNWMTRRFAEARQINPHLPSHDEDDDDDQF